MWMGDFELESVWASDVMGRWSRAEMTYGLDVVANLFSDQLGDVLDEGVLDADLVAVYGGAIVSMA
jgi:hypothetical protein